MYRGLNVHVYPSTFEYETRILKVTRTLVDRRLVERVLVIAMAASGLPREAGIDSQRAVVRVDACLPGSGFWSKALRFMEWSVRVLWRLRGEPVNMVNCHSLSVLPVCVAIKFWHKAILVYEPHELETETATFAGLRRKLAKFVERRLITHAARVIVVSESIARHYRQDYGLAVAPVIMNVPEISAGDDIGSGRELRDYFKIPDGHLLFMYQGALEAERGVLQLMEAFRRVARDKHLVFMGFGSLEGEIREAAELHSNLHLHPAVPPAEVIRFTRSADIGFALLDADCENHRCALPNKLFHYLHAGLPVIVSDLPEMAGLVNRYACGWRVAGSSESIVRCVQGIRPEALPQARAGAQRARSNLHWGNEADKLESIYRDLLESGPTEPL